MRNRLLLSLVLTLFLFQAKAQQVIASGGDYFEGSNISVSWTLGESVTETISNTSNILTQGFQQTKLTVSEIYEINSEDVSISLFPNPTNDFINLKVEDYKNLTIQLFSFDGKLLRNEKITSSKTEISMNNLSASTFFLKIIKEEKTIKTFQIIKQ